MKIKTVSLGSRAQNFDLSELATLETLFKKWRYPRRGEAIFINGKKIHDLNTILRDEDIVIVVAPMRAAAPPLLMKKFKRFLRSVNFKYYKPGKGDHEIWINNKGQKIQVNPNRRDNRYIDWASVESLKKMLGRSQREIIDEVNRI